MLWKHFTESYSSIRFLNFVSNATSRLLFWYKLNTGRSLILEQGDILSHLENNSNTNSESTFVYGTRTPSTIFSFVDAFTFEIAIVASRNRIMNTKMMNFCLFKTLNHRIQWCFQFFQLRRRFRFERSDWLSISNIVKKKKSKVKKRKKLNARRFRFSIDCVACVCIKKGLLLISSYYGFRRFSVSEFISFTFLLLL